LSERASEVGKSTVLGIEHKEIARPKRLNKQLEQQIQQLLEEIELKKTQNLSDPKESP
jgi:hypothetical protein